VLRREHVDVVHAHTAHAVALGAMATRGTGTKFVITRHVDFRLRNNWGTRWKYGRAHALLAISEAARQAMLASGVAPARVQVVRGGTDQTRDIPAAPRACLEGLGVPADAPLVVQVSQHVQHKDPLTFVRAIHTAHRLVPAMHALLVGDGPLRPAVEREVAARGLQDVLHVAGYRSDADGLLAAADVVTLSSEADALPSVLFDALYLGIPIVATAGGGIPEIVEHDVSGLVVPIGDGEAMGRAIASVLTDPALAQLLSDGARARAPEFSIARSVDRTLEVYDRILGTGNGTAP
jgi:glycosyltransferase involved in cell wall biosynthesis